MNSLNLPIENISVADCLNKLDLLISSCCHHPGRVPASSGK
ncbi:MAG: hypothetical protein ACTSVI_05765 [Promethearchaeota archaeon]